VFFSEYYRIVLAHEGLLIVTMMIIFISYRAREYFHYYNFELAEIPQIIGVINMSQTDEEEIELASVNIKDSF
jgi:hypothetical protein